MSHGGAPAVLLMTPKPSPENDAGLEQLLGPERAAELRAALLAHTEAWARKVAPDAFHLADGGASLTDEINRIYSTHEGPLLVIWPWLARLRPEAAVGALDDLAAGCALVLGPLIDGGLYLLGLAGPLPVLLAISEERWQDRDVMATGFATASDSGFEVGILRAERALRSAGDVRAALADPLLPEEIAEILRAGYERASATA
jgi:hypothetical protein